ncbi:MAG: PQQ-like beta-propeller repeat protein [Planctomycetota bacterium]|nr:PQQ-like beta-propeller repeat protein [Planctomycetota bacterium]
MDTESDWGQSSADRPVRWKLFVYGLLAIGVVHAVGWINAPGLTYKVMIAWGTSLGGASFTVAWWCFFSRLPLRTRFNGIGALVLLVAAILAVVRIDKFEYYGDMIPRIEWSFRWQPSREERLSEYFESEEVVQLPVKADATEAPNVTPSPAQNPGTDQTGQVGAQPIDSDIKPSGEAPDVISDDEISNDGDWPEFRGPNRDGIVTGEVIRKNWDKRPPELLWKHPVGEGWSSFAVVGRRAYTQEQRGEHECVVCYEAATGKRVWIHEDAARFEEALGGPGPRATPTVRGDRVYALGATGLLNCLNAFTGEKIWTRNVLDDSTAKNLQWAMSGSPLVVGNLVIVSPGRGVAAYDSDSGSRRWSNGKYPGSYAAPRLEVINGIPLVLIFHGDGLAAHDASSGSKLWESPTWSNSPKINVAQPIVRDGRWVFIGTDYGTGGLLLDAHQIDSHGKAQVVHDLSNRFRLKFNDAVYNDGMLYGADDGILSCIEFKTGKLRWKRGRYGYGQLLLVDNVLLVQAESGKVFLVEATPERFHEITGFSAIDGKTWNHPVVHQGRLFVRNSNEAACFDISPDDVPSS